VVVNSSASAMKEIVQSTPLLQMLCTNYITLFEGVGRVGYTWSS
jgi:hypothetical protein